MIANTPVPDNKGKPFSISDHCHGPIPQIIECKKMKNVIKRKAAETNDTPSSIYQDAIAQVENIIASQISKCSAKSIVKRQRKTNIKEPDHISDLYDLSVDTLSGKKFLNKTIKRNDDYIMIFTTIENCNYLKNSQFWILDGTFKSCPKLFKQFYVVPGSISRDGNDMVFPLVFALMTGKDEDLYNMLFSNLNKFAEENGIFFKENRNLEIITDFELAAINAINNVFPFAIHSACFFHLQQSIYRKIQALGLVTKYKNLLEFNFRARKIASLAFLPPEKVKEAWGILKSEFENDEIDLVTYFEENYVIGKIRMRFRKKEATRYEPCFPIEMWSVHNRTINEMPRTSNSAEGWHNKIHLLLSTHPGIHSFISKIQKEQHETEATIESLISNQVFKRKKYNEIRNNNLLEICKRIVNDSNYNLDEFMRAIANNLKY